jgi:hypothetical protein
MAQSLAPSFAYLVARRARSFTSKKEGAGAISQVPFAGAGFYESTGSDVAVRSQPIVSSPWGQNVIGTLQIGNVVKASGLVQSGGGVDFAEVTSVFDVAGKPSWVATMYLTPSKKTEISGGGGGGGGGGDQPPTVDPSKTGLAESSIFGGGWALAVAIILIAVAIYFVAK